MFRFILYTLLLIIVISIVKSVIGVVMKSFGDFAGVPTRRHGRKAANRALGSAAIYTGTRFAAPSWLKAPLSSGG